MYVDKSLLEEKLEKMDEIFDCDHPECVVAERTFRNNSKNYIIQCKICGSQIGQCIRHETVAGLKDEIPIDKYDGNLEKRWNKLRKSCRKIIEEIGSNDRED